jgi:hypothetical protein
MEGCMVWARPEDSFEDGKRNMGKKGVKRKKCPDQFNSLQSIPFNKHKGRRGQQRTFHPPSTL